MMKSLFNPCTVPYGDKVVRGVAIVCGSCGHQHRVHMNTTQGHSASFDVDEQFAARKFEHDGWKVAKSRGQHRCPDCIRQARAAQMRAVHGKAEEKAMNVVKLPDQVPPEPQREMSRADRRVIFAKLEDVYGDETTGFKPGWSDAKLATDLAVPVAWVKQVREENFGTLGSNPEIEALLLEQRAWRADIVKLLSTADEINARFKALALQGEAIERKVADLQNKMGLVA